MLEAYEEHEVVAQLLGELESVSVGTSAGAVAKVVKENVEHHIEEEEGELFQKAEQALDQEELQELGHRMAARKEEVTEAA